MGSGFTHDSKFTVSDRVEYITVVTEIIIKFSGSRVLGFVVLRQDKLSVLHQYSHSITARTAHASPN